MATIDGSIINIALKTLQDSFGVEFHTVEWVTLSYLLTITSLLPSMGRLGDMIGKRRVALLGFAIFTIGSALCGLAWNIELLIVARVIQGVGAAMLQAVSPALLVTAFPPNERGQALGYTGSIVAAGILTGPVLGGLLLRYTSWPSIFFVNLPIGIAAFLLALRVLPHDGKRSEQRFDIPGALLLAGAVLLILFALTEGQSWGFGDLRTIGLLIGGVIGLIGFVLWERRAVAPMIDLRLFENRTFSLSLVAALGSFLAMSFNFLLLPYYLQEVLQYDPQHTGLILIAAPLVLAVASPLSGRLSDQIGARGLSAIGLVILSGSLFSMATLSSTSTDLEIVLRLMAMGLGAGLFQSPNNSTTMGSAPRWALGIAGSLLAVMRTLGQTAGIALAGAIWAALITASSGQVFTPITTAPPEVLVSGMRGAMLVAGVLAALAIIPALARPRGSIEPGPVAPPVVR